MSWVASLSRRFKRLMTKEKKKQMLKKVESAVEDMLIIMYPTFHSVHPNTFKEIERLERQAGKLYL